MKPTTLPELFMLKLILILTTLPKVFILKLLLSSHHQRMSHCLLKVKKLPKGTALLMLMMSLLR